MITTLVRRVVGSGMMIKSDYNYDHVGDDYDHGGDDYDQVCDDLTSVPSISTK